MRAIARIATLASAMALSGAALCGAAQAAQPFSLTSTSFKEGGVMPLKYAGAKVRPACIGANVAPALAWSGAPAATKSYALVMTDPEGGNGLGVVHLVAYGIPASVTGFKEGDLNTPSPKFVGGSSTPKLSTWLGPCTPPGTAYHHYTFVLIATDLEPAALAPGLSYAELMTKLAGHNKDAAGLVVLFKYPDHK